MAIYLGVFLVIMAALFYKVMTRKKHTTTNKKSDELLNEINVILNSGVPTDSTSPVNIKSNPHINTEVEYDEIKHIKEEFLCSANEKKLLSSLHDALNSDYMIHCQTSLIAVTEPVDFKHKKRANSKRMDFVITDLSSRILAVIELDETSHLEKKRIERDKYVDASLKGIHPFIRLQTQGSYNSKQVAELLEVKANIPNKFRFTPHQEEKIIEP